MAENGPLKISIKAMRTFVKIARINFFRTLKINQRLMAIWEESIQEERLKLNKTSKLYDILTCSISITSLQPKSRLENQWPSSTVETSSVATTGGGRMGLGFLQNFIFRELAVFGLSGHS